MNEIESKKILQKAMYMIDNVKACGFNAYDFATIFAAAFYGSCNEQDMKLFKSGFESNFIYRELPTKEGLNRINESFEDYCKRMNLFNENES